MNDNDQELRPASPSDAGSRLRRLQANPHNGTLSVINTDFGADCDDQKAISQHIAALGDHDQGFFIVSGPHPQQAAQAIAQAYHLKKGKYPVIALGKQFEENKVAKEKIFSLVDGIPMSDQKVEGFEPVLLKELHERIDAAVKTKDYAALKQCVHCPLHSNEEFYDPASRVAADPALKSSWEALPKFAAVQFQRSVDEKGDIAYSGNNFQKSTPDVATGFTEMLKKHGYTTTYFEGAVAKMPEFLLSARQDNLPGVEKAAGAYMESLQVPWANMPGKSGTTPSVEQMHVGMFTAKGEVPFGVHVLGAIPAGFGFERLGREVCGISPEDKRFPEFSKNIGNELERFDVQVLEHIRKTVPEKADMDLPGMRQLMHDAMMGTLDDFAENRGMKGALFESFKEFGDAAKRQGIKINPFTYMDKFKELLIAKQPLMANINDAAATLASRPVADGKSHLNRMTETLSGYNARAVGYDAIAVAAATVLERSPELAAHFKEKDGAHNITAKKINALRESNRELYQDFAEGVRAEVTRDGGAMANEWSRESIGVTKAPQSSAAPKNISDTQKEPVIRADPSQKHNRDANGESIAERVVKRRRRDDEPIAARVARRHRGDGMEL